MTRAARIALLAGAVLLAAVASARAATTLDRVGQAWQTDPVYVDPSAEGAISAADADRVRRAIADRRAGPMYVAVLPAAAADEVGGSPGDVADAAYGELHRDGTYVVLVGDRLAAEATDIGGVAAAADDASSGHAGEGSTAVLLDFAARVGKLRAGDDSGSGDGANGPGGAGAVLALAAAALGGVALVVMRRRGREPEAEELD